MKDFTEAQRLSFQDRLPRRVRSRDAEGRLDAFYIEYYYGALDFGKLLGDPDKSPLMVKYAEAEDNSGDQPALLIFSRPHNPIYVIYPARLYWVDNVRPSIYIHSSMNGQICIATLENFLRGVPVGFGS